MRLKYIEERIPRYFDFGEYEDGFIDIATINDTTFISHISKEDAEKIINDRDFIIRLLHELSKECGESFNKIFYNQIWTST